MSKFSDLDSLYKHIEESAQNFRYLYQIGDLFISLIEKFREESDPENEKLALYEREAFIFEIVNGELSPRMTYSTPEGLVKIPDLDRWGDEGFGYLVERLESTKNPALLARYAHILWESPKKHGKYAQIAIDGYLELVDIYREKDKTDTESHYGLAVVESVKNAYYLARNSGNQDRLDIITYKIKELINEYEYESKSAFALRKYLLELMIEERKFTVEDLKDVTDVAFAVYEKLKGQNASHQAIMMLEIGQRIGDKTGEVKHVWDRLIAEEYEKLMRINAEGNTLAAIHFYENAHKYYKKIKDDKKIEEINEIYDELRERSKYTEFKTKIDMTSYGQFLKSLSEKIKDMSFLEILGILIESDEVIPKYDEVKVEAERILKEHPLLGIFSTVLTDERGHTADRFVSEEEKLDHQIMQNYGLQLQMLKIPLLNTILVEAIKNNKLTYEELMTFLNDNSWIGKPLARRMSPSEEITYRWLDVISPALEEFFKKVNYMLAKDDIPDFVLPIDSLILKIEGLIREICQLSGVTTYYHRDTPQGVVVREKDLHALLYEEKVKELFSEDELFFFKFILVEQSGFNLRHKIAHSLIIYQEYNISIMNIMLLILLRISKYDFTIKKE